MKKTILIVGLLVIILALVISGIYLYKPQPAPNGGTSETYSQISGASIINGKLVFVGTTLKGKEVIVYDNKEYGGEYDRVYKPMLIGGELVYSAYNKKGSETVYYIVQGDKVYTDTNDYYRISYPVDVNGKIAFEAYIGGTKEEANGKSIIIYDEKRFGEQYAWASEIFSVNGKLGYIAKEGSKTFLVVDGKEIGKEYNYVSSPVMINNQLAFSATKKVVNDWKNVFVYDDKEYDTSVIGGGYRDISIVEVNDKPAFSSSDRNMSFVYYDGQKLKPNRQRTNDSSFSPIYYGIKDIEGKLAFEIRYEYCCPDMGDNPSVEGFIYYNGKEYGLEYDSARSPFETNGKLGYIAKEGSKTFLVVDEDVVSEEYNDISFANEINGKLVYIAKKGATYSIYEQ